MAKADTRYLLGTHKVVDAKLFYDIYHEIRDHAVCKPGETNIGGVWHWSGKGMYGNCLQLNQTGQLSGVSIK